ncbi:DUF58 domain-containing protein [Camelimonas abortus]|uniref:DUF58 domain-containing protein n=1 Tax=Camelimonas abortus TaxID=1017184 RepID=UPI0035ECB6B2
MARARTQAVPVAGLFGGEAASRTGPATAVTESARALADRLPRILLQARRVAAAAAGAHGRRQPGPGEDFWQYRPYVPGESAQRIDWRRSARDHRLYVRQREWEAAQRVWFWINLSPSMGFRSSLAADSKAGRALTLGLGLAGALAAAGERVGLLAGAASGGAGAMERLARDIAASLRDGAPQPDLPPAAEVAGGDAVVLVSDCLNPPAELEARIASLAVRGASGAVILVADPVEETFPFAGETVLETPDGAVRRRVGDARAWGEAYRAALASHRAAVAQTVARRGWSLTLHRTDRPASEAALRALTLLAAAGGRGAGGGP